MRYAKLTEAEKNRKLNTLLDALDFKQVVIFAYEKAEVAQIVRVAVRCDNEKVSMEWSEEENQVRVLAMDYSFGLKSMLY